MKLSIAWIFDHIDAEWHSQDIDEIVARFNCKTAEIEDYYRVNYDFSSFAIGTVISSSKNEVKIQVPEWKQEISMTSRSAVNGQSFMVVLEDKLPRWATCKDFSLDKDGLLPAFDVNEDEIDGGWKKSVEARDVIIEVDNKSITHRPDMWGHRGFAREIAAIMDLRFKSSDKLLEYIETKEYKDTSVFSEATPFNIENLADKHCHKFSGMYFSSAQNKASNLNVALRLMRVGSRSINALVDLTNYVMLDWSQPTHIFDANKISGGKIIIRMAQKGEKLTLLDEREIELTSDDLIIADEAKPMALGGVMGGLHDSISENTTSIFLESANFDPTTIRKSALKHKCRTEASARFEKTLDPNQSIDGIRRFVRLAKELNVQLNSSGEIVTLGDAAQEKIISISHDYLERCAGFRLSEKDIVEPLEKIEFVTSPVEGRYDITIPTFRGAKDVLAKEDILEEIIRFYGFDKIEPKLPKFTRIPTSFSEIINVRKIKQFFKNHASMIEQQNYAMFDESFISQIEYTPTNEINIKNPISENYSRMVTSLIPGLLKNIKDNFVLLDEFNFFELGRIWSTLNNKVLEKKSIAGVFFHKRKPLDFYECKDKLVKLLENFGISVTWVKQGKEFWCSEFEAASLVINDQVIGFAGKIDPKLLNNLGVLPESDAFIFELDLDFINSYKPKTHKFEPISRYQEVSFDLSALVPLKVTVNEITKALLVDPLIQEVALIDFFEKEEWDQERSLAFRVRLVSNEKTLEKDDIEVIRSKAISAFEKLGAKLRS